MSEQTDRLIQRSRTRHTPNALHAYTATLKGRGVYGLGDTPAGARECLRRQLEDMAAEKQDKRKAGE